MTQRQRRGHSATQSARLHRSNRLLSVGVERAADKASPTSQWAAHAAAAIASPEVASGR